MNIPDNHQTIAERLGMTLWTTDLFMPGYRSGEFSDWRIQTGGQLNNDWGYYSGTHMVEMMPYLQRRSNANPDVDADAWHTWMSLTPHEIESQELGCRNAIGHTVIMGLGMGWMAANVALNPAVTRVTVVERDSDVIDLFSHSGALESIPLPARNKIVIVQADALEWCPQDADSVDLLYADIWLALAEPGTLKQVRDMQANVQAGMVYYWGQEIAIHTAVRHQTGSDAALTDELVQQAVDQVIGLPLLIPADRDYPQMIDQVIRNRQTRKLPTEAELT